MGAAMAQENATHHGRHLLQQWGPQARVRRRPIVSKTAAMTNDLREKILTGEGCWWQGDGWQSVTACCDCGKGCSEAWLTRCCSWTAAWSQTCCECDKTLADGP